MPRAGDDRLDGTIEIAEASFVLTDAWCGPASTMP
jgi:hypothetical protein